VPQFFFFLLSLIPSILSQPLFFFSLPTSLSRIISLSSLFRVSGASAVEEEGP
jgi:hypothetical protein